MKKITILLFLFCLAANAQFSEGFETGGIPAGWSVINNGDANTWTVFNLTGDTEHPAHSGNFAAAIVYSDSPHSDYLVTPAITVTAGVNDYLTFWGRSRDPQFPENIHVKLSTTGTAASNNFTITLLPTVAPPGGTSFYKYSVDLSDFVGLTVNVAFFSDTDYQFIFELDDVVNAPLPICREPNEFQATATSDTTASLAWLRVGLATNFTIEYGPAGFVLGSGTSIFVSDANSTVLTGLLPDTVYDAYIRSSCSAPLHSTWVPLQFTTKPVPPTNDNCSNPIMLTVGNDFETGAYLATNVGSTLSAVELDCGGSSYMYSDVWYDVTVPSDGNLTIETRAAEGSGFYDSVIEAYRGDCGALVSVGCDDDGAPGGFSLLNLTGLNPGEVLHIGVWEYKYLPIHQGAFKISVYNTTLGANEFDVSNLRSFPNPFNDVINVSDDVGIENVRIYNLLGQQLLSQNVQGTEAKIDGSTLPSGQYLMKVKSSDSNRIIKINKQ